MSNPIGLFDSGVGGLTVLQEIAYLLPHEHCVYFADTARFPYGDKPREMVVRFARENGEFLLSQGIKLLVIPCYTASSYAFKTLQTELPIPVIAITPFGIQQLAQSTATQTVAILGTTNTIASGTLQAELRAQNPHLQIHPIACPLFAPLVEKGMANHPDLIKIVHDTLVPLQGTNIDAALLACTHYPLLSPLIQQVLGPRVQLISPARLCAQYIGEFLTENEMLNQSGETATYRVFVSAEPFFTMADCKIKLAQNKTL